MGLSGGEYSLSKGTDAGPLQFQTAFAAGTPNGHDSDRVEQAILRAEACTGQLSHWIRTSSIMRSAKESTHPGCGLAGIVYNHRMNRRVAALSSARGFRYVEPLAPIVFPEEAEVPETQLHLELRTLLYQLLSDYLGLETTVGSDQFVYFDAADPTQCVAPDVYVRLEPRGEPIRSWKTWERGAPEVAVEIISESDATESAWAQKLAAYRRLGVCELVRFDPEQSGKDSLRIWDRVEEALVERDLSSGFIPSSVLNLHWVIAPAESFQCALRIADASQAIVSTRLEARQVEAEARQVEAEARQAAEIRIQELEAQLKLTRR